MICDTLIASDAEAILNIPLHHGGGGDFFAWAFDRSGSNYVKTAYRARMTQKERESLEEGTATGTTGKINRCGRLFERSIC